MKYISLENLEKARLQPTCGSQHLTEYAAGQLDGWNKCIDTLIHLAIDETDIYKEISDRFSENARWVKPHNITGNADDLDAGFLEALQGCHAEPADNIGYPDCEECRFSGLLTDD